MTGSDTVVPVSLGSAFAEEAPDEELFRALTCCVGDPERERIQEILVHRYAGLVQHTASRYANRAIEHEELRQVGFVGLLLAVQRFDPDRGTEFAAFARPTVQGEVRRYFRDKRRWIRLPRRLQETKAILRDAIETLTHELRRGPTTAEIAAYLDVEEKLVLEAMSADDVFAPTSLDAPVSAGAGESYTVADTLGEADRRMDLIVDCETLRPLLAALPARSREILRLRFFEDKTQSEIGRQVGLSQMQISRLLARTASTLRTQMLA